MTQSVLPYSRKVGSQAEVPSVVIDATEVMHVSGYQVYRMRKQGLVSAKVEHRLKYALIRPYLLSMFKHHKVLDIGCSAGVIGLQAVLDGCQHVHFLDHDPEYIDVVKQVHRFIGQPDSNTHVSSLGKFDKAMDVGFAFAIIHWIYSYSEQSGSLEKAIKLLHNICPQALFIEWVAPEDYAIGMADHIRQNQGVIEAPYDFEHFQAALKQHYKHIQYVGKVTKTREIWLASNLPIHATMMLLVKSTLASLGIRAKRLLSLKSVLRSLGLGR